MINEEIKNSIDNIIQNIGYIPEFHELNKLLNISNMSNKKLINYYIKNYNCSYLNYYRNKNFRKHGDVIYNNKIYSVKELTPDVIKGVIREFVNKNGHFPKYNQYNFENNLPAYTTTKNILKRNGLNFNDISDELNIIRNKNSKEYEYWLKELKKIICKNNNNVIRYTDYAKNGLPYAFWFVNNCTNNKVNTYSDFLRYELNVTPSKNMSKDDVIKAIMQMQKDVGRPLKYDDFKSKSNKPLVGINAVNRHFGSMNKMKKELGLKIIQDDMLSKHIDDIELIKNDLLNVCKKVESEFNRKIISVLDFEKYTNLNIKFSSIRSSCKQHKTTPRKIIEELGYSLQKEGLGIVSVYNDGEKTKSSYERKFSDKLREYGYSYKKDYYRDVKYKKFINNYEGLLDCDYIINVNGNYIFIEVACLLDENQDYKEYNLYKSNSKKRYAKKLIEKENMFIKENLNYFLLFVSDFKKYNLDFLFTQKLGIPKKEVV